MIFHEKQLEARLQQICKMQYEAASSQNNKIINKTLALYYEASIM